MDTKGRPRPDGYKMEVDAREAAVLLSIVKTYADGVSHTRIVQMLNEEAVPGRILAWRHGEAGAFEGAGWPGEAVLDLPVVGHDGLRRSTPCR